MAIKFQCPHCKSLRSANDRLLGREINCPECGGTVQLPSAEDAERAKKRRDAQRQEQRQQDQDLARATQALKQTVVVEAELSDEEIEEQMTAEEKALASATANFLSPKPPAGDDMDMTPMVDVTFLLLIFFMITASFSVQKTIQRPAVRNDEASTNATVQPDEQNPDVVTVQVDEFNAYNIITTAWDRPAGSKQDLIVSLNEAHDGGGSTQPSKLVIQAHEDCIHAAVVAALDAGREAKFESFEVRTVEQFD